MTTPQHTHLPVSFRRVATGRRAGFTLVEITVVAVVLIVVTGAVANILLSSQRSYAELLQTSTADEVARRTVDRVVGELRGVRGSTLSLPLATPVRLIRFERVEGWDGTGAVSGPQHEISFDSGRILVDGVPVAAGVDDLSFTSSGDALTVRVTVTRSYPSGETGAVISRSAVSQVRL